MKARDNPFRTECVLKIRYRPVDLGWNGILARLEAIGYRAAIVGPEGSGKTTLLEDLAARLGERGFRGRIVRLDRGACSLPRGHVNAIAAELTKDDVVLVDGADELGALAWRRFRRATRAAGGLVMTSHKAGRLPTLVECRTTPPLLTEILQDLVGVEAARLEPAAFSLLDEHRGDIRKVLRDLFDLYPTLSSAGAGPLCNPSSCSPGS